MSTLKELYDEHGAGVWLTNIPDDFYGINPFMIVSEADERYYNVKYKNGAVGTIMKECPGVNDYMPLDEYVESLQ